MVYSKLGMEAVRVSRNKGFGYNCKALDLTTSSRTSASGLAQQKAGAPYCRIETTKTL